MASRLSRWAFDGLDAHGQLVPDFTVGGAGGEAPQNLELAVGQQVHGVFTQAIDHAEGEVLSQGRRNEPFPFMNRANGLGQFGRSGVLDHVTASADSQQPGRVMLVGVHGQYDHAGPDLYAS